MDITLQKLKYDIHIYQIATGIPPNLIFTCFQWYEYHTSVSAVICIITIKD